MRPRTVFFVLVGAACAVGLAVAAPAPRPGGLAADAPAPAVADPLPFDHVEHETAFAKADVTCVHCHPVGARTAAGAPGAVPTPLSTCHGCHLGELPGSPRRAQNTCSSCHPHRAELQPANHGLGWLEAHGPEARALGASGSACHDRTACIDCHEGRGATSRTPHPPGFRATHGIEARVDPASCSTCHTEDVCAACHVTGVTPW
jgi:hypothetical protein